MTLDERLLAAIGERTPDGCWIWGHVARVNGYGRIKVAGRSMLAHRVAYEVWVGEIPEGLEIDHLCRVRDCVNPDHLEPVTRTENMHRSPYVGAKIRQTHCVNGHAYDQVNTHIRTNGTRQCRACRRIAVAAWAQKQRI